ncbi:MAG: hypothetical protein ORN54_04785 [Cyclobacteriaceae bacterium]|nr:hypothetical protein [Cyclobacteriaceae bacterium]
MKNFEDQLKDAFDGFEPEAPSSVWNHVQQSISNPAAPSASTKVITAKLGFHDLKEMRATWKKEMDTL